MSLAQMDLTHVARFHAHRLRVLAEALDEKGDHAGAALCRESAGNIEELLELEEERAAA